MRIGFLPSSSLLLVCSFASVGPAQEPAKAIPPEVRMALEAAGAGVPVAAQPVAAGVPSKPDDRAQKLQQLRFDRRASAILAAWSSPDLKPPEEDPELALPELPPQPQPPQPGADGTPPDEAAQKAFAEAQKAFAEAQQKRAEIEARRAQRVMDRVARDVTLGRWGEVAAFLESLPEKDRKPSYLHLVNVLNAPPPANPQPGQQVPGNFHEQNVFTFEDVIAIGGIAPGGLEVEQIAPLSRLLNRALAEGRSFEDLVQRLHAECARPEAERAIGRRQCALLLAAIGREVEMGDFLPKTIDAVQADDREALNLLARHHLAVHAKEGGVAHLERAWDVTQAALAAGKIDEKEKTDALRRAVGLAPRIRPELGREWLEESFTERPERGAEILATIGAQAARGQQEHAQDAPFRTENLRLQKIAVEALLEHAPERAQEWIDSIRLLAANWVREANHTYRHSETTQMGPMMHYDSFGNAYYTSRGGNWGRSPVAALEPEDMLEFRPEGRWLEMLEASMRPEIAAVTARLYLKVHEEVLAFPFIEELAKTHETEAKELADEFLRVWIRNHDPNSERNRTNSYYFAYGFNQRAEGIPLTRSKQERNLKDLAEWVAKLRALPIDGLNEELVLQAFVGSHSTAEVFGLDTIAGVFGSFESMEPDMLAGLAQTMRANLATVWRLPRVQEAAKTNRKQKDIEREVMAGYQVATAVVQGALIEHPDSWRLRLAKAALLHDRNEYRRDIATTSEFAGERLAALAEFRRAAEQYAESLDPESTKEETSEVYEHWFYASLGASDLGGIDERTTSVHAQFPLIRSAIEGLPGEAAERHLARFANTLFTRMSSVHPSVKFRYLESGFAIVGDHPRAREAQRVFQYYKDLVTEIRLDVQVEGAGEIGHGEPFGLRVSLLHTREIERESGGFAKYLQNQNTQPYAYNYGRPPEDYRDKFEEAARAALNETFEVLSVTFNDMKANSKAADDYGWRRTPYAYLLVQARRPEVDRIPSLKIDLDFLDTTGYVVLPIASSVIPVDASRASSEPRPYESVEITQILDERKAEEGELTLEIKAIAHGGLVPDLETLLELAPKEFEIVETGDKGVAVSRFDDDQDSVVSERIWNVKLRAREDLEQPAETFEFAAPLDEATKVVYQRYDDADLLAAEPVVALGVPLGDGGTSAWWFLLPLALAIGAVALMLRKSVGQAESASSVRLPERLTPFTVIALLETIAQRQPPDSTERREIRHAVQAIEKGYFSGNGAPAPDLRDIAEDWVRRVEQRV